MSDEQQGANGQPRPPEWDLYEQLAEPFEITFRDLRGGVELEYITGEQATTRLNESLGFLAWSFRIVEHGIHPEADECWALGELTATIGDRTVVRQQFGSQKIKRSRSSGTPLDIGFDLKGAATDALKKCASLIGVALYLWHKEPPAGLGNAAQGGRSGPRSLPSSGAGGSSTGPIVNDLLIAPACEDCGEPLTDTTFKNGDVWTAAMLANSGRRKYGRALCMRDYRAAKTQAGASSGPAF